MRGAYWTRVALVIPLTLPWAFWSWSGWQANSDVLARLAELPARVVQFGWEASVAVPWLAWLVLLPLCWRRLSERDRSWLALISILLASYAALTPLLLQTRQLWHLGLRYNCALLALGASASALFAVRASRGRPLALAAILLVLGFTHLGSNALPWLWLRPAAYPSLESAAPHVPATLVAKLFRTEWLGFARELRERETGTVSDIVEVLRRVATPGDRLITNADWEPLTFHTGLPQALKVLPSSPILDAARRAGLPEYVFGVDEARWVVWRFVWEGIPPYRFEDVQQAIRERGGLLEPVARFHETRWENRPELHFHRFPGLGQLYPSLMTARADRPFPEALLFRIHWPGDVSAGSEAAEGTR